MKTLGLITARGGSKGLPRKNILQAGDRPLIAWTINAAANSKVIDQVILSSDDEEIISTSLDWGCHAPFRRPAELSNDTANSIDVVLHALDQLPKFEFIVLLQPTSPLRTSEDIDAAFSLMQSCSAPSCISVCEVDQSPYWMYQMKDTNKLVSILPKRDAISRRQDLPPAYIPNGAIYIARVEWLRLNRSFIGDDTIGFVMPKERSIDIDSIDDFHMFLTYANTHNLYSS